MRWILLACAVGSLSLTGCDEGYIKRSRQLAEYQQIEREVNAAANVERVNREMAADKERSEAEAKKPRASFEAAIAGMDFRGMTPAEKKGTRRCMDQAERVYNIALATHRVGSYDPDLIALERLINCMSAGV
jgi:hypothetical protein